MFMSRRPKFFALGAAISVAFGLMLLPTAAGAGTASVGRVSPKSARLDWSAPRTAAQKAALLKQGPTSTPIQDFTETITDGTSHFNYTMIGKDPLVTQAKPVTNIKTYLQPIVFKFADGFKWDPTVADSCDATSALVRTQQSPIFVAQRFKFGGTSVGKAQYVDAFQRASFFDQTNPSGINPGYHVKLTLITLPKMTINVPAASSTLESSTVCGNGLLGGVEINYWDNLVQTTLLPQLATEGVTLKDFPFFLFGNVVMYDTSPGNCCILGYHNSMGSGSTFQSYGNGLYDNTGDFSGSGDVSAISHEVAEWMDDPNTVNPTKPWGHIGQVSGCQSNLEVGDPLSGTVFTFKDPLTLKTYHLQEMAFYSWFFHQSPSQGVNGWYSNKGTFLTSAAHCS
jgi:hypothetical protein